MYTASNPTDPATRADLANYVDKVVNAGLPALYNGALIPASEAQALGFRIQILAGAALMAAYAEVYQAMLLLRRTGDASAISAEIQAGTPAGQSLTDILGLPAVYESERRYSVGQEA